MRLRITINYGVTEIDGGVWHRFYNNIKTSFVKMDKFTVIFLTI